MNGKDFVGKTQTAQAGLLVLGAFDYGPPYPSQTVHLTGAYNLSICTSFNEARVVRPYGSHGSHTDRCRNGKAPGTEVAELTPSRRLRGLSCACFARCVSLEHDLRVRKVLSLGRRALIRAPDQMR